ncbi:MAG: hypothetical protein MJZ20_03070 [Bacteroidaceae bacterium]|nr:hypothetical protein [Bacteroidaceae bacterium]
MVVIENLRLILESIHTLLERKMDKMDIATDSEIAIRLADSMGLTIYGEGDDVFVDENNNIYFTYEEDE